MAYANFAKYSIVLQHRYIQIYMYTNNVPASHISALEEEELVLTNGQKVGARHAEKREKTNENERIFFTKRRTPLDIFHKIY